MKCILGPKKTRRIEALTGRAVDIAYTRGGWRHYHAEVWFKDGGHEYGVRYGMTRRERRAVSAEIRRQSLVELARMTGATLCDKCQKPLKIGDYPFCPHGSGSNGIEDATWPGGITFENLGHEPVTLYSPAELKRELKARNLEPMVRWTPGDQHTRSWATMDPYTLENGRILAERQAQSTVRHHDPGPNPATVAEVKRAFEEYAAR